MLMYITVYINSRGFDLEEKNFLHLANFYQSEKLKTIQNLNLTKSNWATKFQDPDYNTKVLKLRLASEIFKTVKLYTKPVS